MTKRASGSPQPLPSPPASIAEEDISREYWSHEQQQDKDHVQGSSSLSLDGSAKRRGKERARDVEVMSGGGDDVEEDEDEDEGSRGGIAGYPPTKEQEGESRRIEEVCSFFLSTS